jgi:hypothetical protein
MAPEELATMSGLQAAGRDNQVGGPLISSQTAQTQSCSRCGASLKHGFRMAGELRCLRCTLLRLSLLRRSLYTGLVVGTILTAINQGNILLNGHFPPALYWKIPLTYCVPFCVATWGALINSRS